MGIVKILKILSIVVCLGFPAGNADAAPNSRVALRLFLNQAGHAAVPDFHAALFRFLNPQGDPVAVQFGLNYAFGGIPVELEPGESAIATLGWFMYVVDDCESVVVREVVDFDSPQCAVPNPEESDFDTLLAAITALPEECLAPAATDPCSVMEEAMRYDIGTGVSLTKKILKSEILHSFALDGTPLAPDYDKTQFFNYLLGAGNPDEAPSLSCADDLYYAPVFAYLTYGYQLPSLSGKCILNGSGVHLGGLSPGEHEFTFEIEFAGEAVQFPPVTIIQK